MKTKFIGKKIIESLTKEQIVQLLDATFALWDEEKTNILLSQVDKDIAITVSQLFSPETSGSEPVISDKKYIEEWKSLWDEWFYIINQIGDENGKYATREHHWEPPYFNSYDMAEDLDKVAEDMLPILEKIYAIGRESDGIFEEAVEEIEDNIKCYPEWMGAEHDECYVGSVVTHCLLKWKWLAADSPITFLNSLIQVQNGLRIIEIDKEMIIRFFNGLSYDDRKRIYDYLALNRDTSVWSDRLNSVHSEWHRIYHTFSEEFNIHIYLDNCRRMLHEDWQYGLPLIEDLLNKKEEAEAEKIYEETIASYVCQRTRNSWTPETSLLISALMYGYGNPDGNIIRLLKEWIGLTEKLGMKTRSAALNFQLTTYQSPYDWDKVFKIIRQTDMAEVSDLIAQWQHFTFVILFGRSFGNTEDLHDCWIRWLIESELDDKKDKVWFSQKIEAWLTALSQSSKTFQSQKELIYFFTCEFAEISDLKKIYPSLVEMVRNESCKKAAAASIQSWLRNNMEGEQYLPLLMECWKENIIQIMPNPANAHNAVYDFHALWLCVVSEIDPTAYKDILEQWRTEHKRRRNLWKAIQTRGLSI